MTPSLGVWEFTNSSANFPSAVPNQVTIFIPPNLFSIIGPYFIGSLLNWAGMGVLVNQIYTYYLSFPEDPQYVRALVYFLGVLQVAQTVIITDDCWNWLIASWAKPEGIIATNLAWFDGPILVGIISFIAQCFYAWRIWMLGRSGTLAGVIILLALTQCASAFACGVQIFMAPNFNEIAPLTPGIIWLATSGAVDVIISTVMVYFLTRQKKKGTNRTDFLISRLVRLTIETGSLTSCVAVAEIIIFKVCTHTTYHVVPSFVLAKLYGISLMLIFNNRVHIRRQTQGIALAVNGTPSQRSLRLSLSEPSQFLATTPNSNSADLAASHGRMNPIPALQRAWISFASTFREDDEEDEAIFDNGLLTLPIHMEQRLGESTMPTFHLIEATPKDTHPPVSFSSMEVLDTV